MGNLMRHHCNRFARLLIALMLAAVIVRPSLAGPNVLLLWDDDQDSVVNSPPLLAELNPNTQALVAALEAAGIHVALADFTQSIYDGDSPEPNAFDVVLHLNGNTTSTIDTMSASTVFELVDYVENLGGGFITSENTEAQMEIPFVGLSRLMENLASLDRGAGAAPPYGEITVNPAPGLEDHPLLTGLSFPLAFTGGRMRAQLRNYPQQPATVVLQDDQNLSAAAVRDVGIGRSVTFHHTGNFRSSGTFSDTLLDPDVQRLYINAVLWADRTRPKATLVKESAGSANVNGAPYHLTFSEDITGLDSTDFQITAQGVTFSPTLDIDSISGREYRVTIKGLAGAGTIGLSLLENGTIRDQSFNQNPLASGATGESYTVDAVVPDLTGFAVDPLVVPIGERAEFTLAFDEPMDTAYAPVLRIVTGANAVITASPAVAPPDGRVKDGLLALYTFDEGAGDTVYDRSGTGTALDLAIAAPGNVHWVEGGLTIDASTVLLTTGAATKLIDGCKASNEVTIEAWIQPANIAQAGPARLVTISAGLNARNVTLEQDGADLEARLRTTDASTNGLPELSATGTASAAALQHVVFTRAADGTERLYVDNVLRASDDVTGDFSTWAGSYKLALGNELSQNRPWLGTFYLVAMFDRALTALEVEQNFTAGPVTVLPGNGIWLNGTTYRVSMDRAVVLADQGSAQVEITGARDLAGNPMAPGASNIGIINSTLLIESQPEPDYVVEAGTDFELVVDVAGAIGGLQYQWFKESANKVFLPVGTNAPVLAFAPVTQGDAGTYYCHISDSQASVQTTPTELVVVAELPVGAAALLALISSLIAAAAKKLRSRKDR